MRAIFICSEIRTEKLLIKLTDLSGYLRDGALPGQSENIYVADINEQIKRLHSKCSSNVKNDNSTVNVRLSCC